MQLPGCLWDGLQAGRQRVKLFALVREIGSPKPTRQPHLYRDTLTEQQTQTDRQTDRRTDGRIAMHHHTRCGSHIWAMHRLCKDRMQSCCKHFFHVHFSYKKYNMLQPLYGVGQKLQPFIIAWLGPCIYTLNKFSIIFGIGLYTLEKCSEQESRSRLYKVVQLHKSC